MPDHGKITRVVSSVGKTRTLEMEDGGVIERSGGSVSWRNNNPGNLKFEFAGSADKTVTTVRTREQALEAAQGRYKGVVDLDQWGNAIFESYEAGRAAKVQLLERKFGERTVVDMLKSYSTPDYSGKTNHAAQAEFIYREGDRQGVDLRNKKISDMTPKELAALADGIKGFEGFKPGEVREISPPTRTLGASRPSAEPQTPSQPQAPAAARAGSAAIFDEAYQHFFKEGRQYEYGRNDIRKPGRDPSRLERDGDGDGRLGVDCSAFVWRGLKNAGYDVPGSTAAAFTTHTLFNGRNVTAYAKEHFDVVSAADARRPGGSLEPGDILMFANARGQHVGIFKGYDEKGRIQYIGSQSSTGPALVTIEPNGYWDGKGTTIVGALRAKPEFQVRAPLHGTSRSDERDDVPKPAAQKPSATTPASKATVRDDRDGAWELGEQGPGIVELQRRLNRLGYTDAKGRALAEDGVYGKNTRDAVVDFQRDHGLQGLGMGGPRTARALDEAEAKLVSSATHPQNAMYRQVLEQVHALEKARGIVPGEHSAKLAAALTVEAVREGLTKVDRVELGTQGALARAVQVSPVSDEPGLNRSTDGISTEQAMRQSLRESSEQITQVVANVQAREREQRTQPALAL